MSDRTDRQDMTIRDVAKASGVDRRVLTNQLKEGRFPNAFRETSAQGVAKGPWFIPVDDLAAAGIALEPAPPARNGDGPTSSALRAELEAVRAELTEERSRRKVAEALASERATAIDDLRDAIRTMEALASPSQPAPAETPPAEPPRAEPQPPAPTPPVREEPRRPRLRGQWLR
jgi:predicted DNA-binding protein (UPF0251 family)